MTSANRVARGGPARNSRGAASVELVIVVPALLVILALMVAGWRISAAKSEVTMAAQAGARAASLALTGTQARSAAQHAVNANLANAGVSCSSSSVSVDVSDFAKPAGQSGTVRVTVTCTVPLSDLVVPGMPGQVVAKASASSVLDTFRRRQP